jgi:8-oxo-dGTP pyrophosphatase MutT (NUDIX family)
MTYEHLQWTEVDRKEVYRCRVFSVRDTKSRAPDGENRTFTVLDAPDWAIVIPVAHESDGDRFLMVRQWRHGADELSLEFPGGVLEDGEDGDEAAGRELEEETGWTATSMRKLGTFNPNPAIMSNTVHIFLADGLYRKGKQKLDADEYVDAELIKVAEVIEGMGRPPYVHALMASALALYLRLGRGA